jgi:hypothetical protein
MSRRCLHAPRAAGAGPVLDAVRQVWDARGVGIGDRLADRFASSRAGRALLSVAIVVLLGALVGWNLPPGAGPSSGESAFKRDMLAVGTPVINALGLDQNWSVFAPPRLQVITLSAKIRYADGSTVVWRAPVSTGALFGEYRDNRWGKYVESAIMDANSGVLWQPLAAWVARTHASRGHRILSVTLVRRFYDLYPETGVRGSVSRGPWISVSYFVYLLPRGRAR